MANKNQLVTTSASPLLAHFFLRIPGKAKLILFLIFSSLYLGSSFSDEVFSQSANNGESKSVNIETEKSSEKTNSQPNGNIGAGNFSEIAAKLVKDIKEIKSAKPGAKPRIAVMGFDTDESAEFEKLSTLVAERLTTSLVQTKQADVLERRLARRQLSCLIQIMIH